MHHIHKGHGKDSYRWTCGAWSCSNTRLDATTKSTCSANLSHSSLGTPLTIVQTLGVLKDLYGCTREIHMEGPQGGRVATHTGV